LASSAARVRVQDFDQGGIDLSGALLLKLGYLSPTRLAPIKPVMMASLGAAMKLRAAPPLGCERLAK
jgi:hypothetical protein